MTCDVVFYSDQPINKQSMKPKKTQSENENWSLDVEAFASPPLKLQNLDDSSASTFEDLNTDAIVKRDSQRIQYDQLGKVKESLKKHQFHPYKKVNVENHKSPQPPQSIDLPKEAPKEIDEFLFGAQSVGEDFDWTYIKNFKQLYEEDRWEGYGYEISDTSSPRFAIHKNLMNSEHGESLNTNYIPNPTSQGSSSFVGLMENDGTMMSGGFGDFDTETLSIQNASEYSPGGGEEALHCLLSHDHTINRKSNKPASNRLNNSQWSHDSPVNEYPPSKLQNPDDTPSSTSEEVNTDSMNVDNESVKVEHDQLRKIKATARKLQFHPYKKINVPFHKNPQSPNPINSPEEAPKGIDEFCFGAESVGANFDWSYLKNFKQMYEEDRWRNYNYEIGKDGLLSPTSPSFD